MALSHSLAPKCAIAPSSSIRSINFNHQRSLLGIGKYYSNNVVADLVYRSGPNVSTFRKGSYNPAALTVKSLKRVDVVEPDAENKVVKLIDGLEPAILTPPTDVHRDDFPHDFKFGASTSALQIEGDGTEGGRGPSTWDFMIQADKGGKGVDSYNLYMEDVKLLKSMGMNSYRFSIAWPRLLPQGTEEDGELNKEGVDYYNRLIDALVAEGIEPVVTLFHFDLPVALQNKYYGFMNSQIVKDFAKYAEICFDKFGDRVKYWSTINEPYVFGSFGYKMGLPQDMQNDPMGPYIATHNIILAHAAAAKVYHDKYQRKQKGKIGISLPCKWFEPQSTDPQDVDAAKKHLDFMLGWYMDPFINGEYPDSMREFVKDLPKFTKDEITLIKEACDYIGVNYYTARFSKQQFTVDGVKGEIVVKYLEDTKDKDGNPIGEQAQGQPDIYVYPEGIKKLLLYIKEKYDDPELLVTENGMPAVPTLSGSVPTLIEQGKIEELKAAFYDDYRITHAEDHLIAIREARSQGAKVKGFFAWSLMDNMEVGAGYDVRFGLNFVDYFDNHKRYPKKSAVWFNNFLTEAPRNSHKKLKKDKKN